MKSQTGICYIVGAMSLTPGLCPHPAPGDYVIAADRGFDSLLAYGVMPDLAVGDFDSLGEVPSGKNVIRHPVEKDDTDMMLAVKTGLSRGCRTFVLYGGIGGRLDHTYANLQTLTYLSDHGARGYLLGDGFAATAWKDGVLDFPAGLTGPVSVFCPGEKAEGVSIEGLYYPLQNAVLTSGFPLGVSNQFIGVSARVSVRKGTLLAMWQEAPASLLERL